MDGDTFIDDMVRRRQTLNLIGLELGKVYQKTLVFHQVGLELSLSPFIPGLNNPLISLLYVTNTCFIFSVLRGRCKNNGLEVVMLFTCIFHFWMSCDY